MDTADRDPRTTAPRPLLAAALITALEGVLAVLFGLAELLSLTSGRALMGLTTSLFFVILGVGFCWVGWALTRRQTWARGPALLAQLIALGSAWSFWGADTLVVSLGLGALGVIGLVAMLHPESVRALDDSVE